MGALLVLFVLTTSLALGELSARLFWCFRYGVPLSRPDAVLSALYPELWQVDWKAADFRGQDPVRILFLGGSVLNPAWGTVEEELRERLTVSLGRPIVVFNMAEIGHTSRDSDVKYRALDGRHFDLVVFYHGINEARANNVPRDSFRFDYSHYAWYDGIRAIETCRESPWLMLPCTLRFLSVRVKDRTGLVEYVSMDAPRKEWVAYGADIKTAGPFEANLRDIVTLAHARGEPVLAMTFATYVPDDYSLQAFNLRKLDYTLHLTPIELWGTPKNVLAAVARHNEVVRAVASTDRRVRLVDQEQAMPKGRRYFNDVCHLTTAGSAAFVDNMLGAVVDLVGPASASH